MCTRHSGFLAAIATVALATSAVGVPAVVGANVLVPDAEFSPPSDASQAELGTDVAISGNVAVLGSPGRAYAVVRDQATGWGSLSELAITAPPGSDPSGFGMSVAVSGDTIVVGAPQEDMPDPHNAAINLNMAGAAYVFVRDGASWDLQQRLTAAVPGAGDKFGSALAIDGETIAVGAVTEDGAATGVNGDATSDAEADSGAVYVFDRSGTSWSQSAYIKASNTDPGDWFGFSVDVDSNTVVVGAAGEASSSIGAGSNQSNNDRSFAGAAYIFTRSSGSWSQQAYLKPSNTRSGFMFGSSVGVSGATVAVGAAGEDSAATGVGGNQANTSADDAGAVYVFRRSISSWAQQAYIKASNTDADDEFGVSVGLDGDRLVVGAMNESSAATGINGNQASDSEPSAGAAYVFSRSGTSWSQAAYLKASDTDEHDNFGLQVAVSGNSVLVGAPGDAPKSGEELDDVHGGHVFRWVTDVTPPQTQAVVLGLRDGGQINSAPVRVSWSASDETSAVSRLRHTVQIRNRTSSGWSSWRSVVAGTASTEVHATIALGTVFQARARTRDEAGNVGQWALSNTLKAWTRQESKFSKSGGWASASDPQAMGDRVIRSNDANANARLTFTGRGVGAVMPLGPALGTARICVDRGQATEVCVTVNLATAGSGPRRIVALFGGLAVGSHTLDVRVVTGLVILDGAIVLE